jgi:Tim44-like domain
LGSRSAVLVLRQWRALRSARENQVERINAIDIRERRPIHVSDAVAAGVRSTCHEGKRDSWRFVRANRQPRLTTRSSDRADDFEHCWPRRLGAYALPATSALAIGPADYDAFEKLLGEVQEAYGREYLDALGDRLMPEMLSYLAQDLADNAKKGLRNELSGVKLLQGDLSEAWREVGGEFATVAMRYAIVDVMVDRATCRVVGGDRSVPQEVTEVWTFRRDPGRPSANDICRDCFRQSFGINGQSASGCPRKIHISLLRPSHTGWFVDLSIESNSSASLQAIVSGDVIAAGPSRTLPCTILGRCC